MVLIYHMQIPAVYCRPTTKRTLLPTAHQKASCWWKWLIHKIFFAEAKIPNGRFKLLMTTISHSLTSEYCKGLSIYRKLPRSGCWQKNRSRIEEAVTRQDRDVPSKAAVNNRLGKNPIIWQDETAKVSDKLLSACQAKALCKNILLCPGQLTASDPRLETKLGLMPHDTTWQKKWLL